MYNAHVDSIYTHASKKTTSYTSDTSYSCETHARKQKVLTDLFRAKLTNWRRSTNFDDSCETHELAEEECVTTFVVSPRFPKVRHPYPLLVHSILLVFCVHVWCGLRLCVSQSVMCFQDSCFKVRQMRIPKEHLSHNLNEHCMEDTRMTWCLSYPTGEAPFPRCYFSQRT